MRGMRITAFDVLSYLAAGMTNQEILDDLPHLTAKGTKKLPHEDAAVEAGECVEVELRRRRSRRADVFAKVTGHPRTGPAAGADNEVCPRVAVEVLHGHANATANVLTTIDIR